MVGINAGYANSSTDLNNDGKISANSGFGGVYATLFGGAYVVHGGGS